MFNWYVFFGIVSRLILILGFLLIVVPQQLRAFKESEAGKVYQWLMFLSSMGFLLFSVLPVNYQLIRLDSPGEFSLINIASLSGNLAILFIGLPIILFYALVRRGNKRLRIKKRTIEVEKGE